MVADEDGGAVLFEVVAALDAQRDADEGRRARLKAAGDDIIDVPAAADEAHGDRDADAPERVGAERDEERRQAEVVPDRGEEAGHDGGGEDGGEGARERFRAEPAAGRGGRAGEEAAVEVDGHEQDDEERERDRDEAAPRGEALDPASPRRRRAHPRLSPCSVAVSPSSQCSERGTKKGRKLAWVQRGVLTGI